MTLSDKWSNTKAEYRKKIIGAPDVSDDTPVVFWSGTYNDRNILPDGSSVEFTDDNGRILPAYVDVTNILLDSSRQNVKAWVKLKEIKGTSYVYLRFVDVNDDRSEAKV